MTETNNPNVTIAAQAADEPSVPEAAVGVDIDEAIEAILFAAGHAVTYEQLGKLFEIPAGEMRARVVEYARRYNSTSLARGVTLLAYDEACQLCTKPVFLPYIRAALGIRKSGSLSASSIETLAVVAYNQPVTRAYIDAVRGVDSSYAVTNLVDRGLIEPKGRMDAPGRPVLFGTTPDFLRCFGISSLSELPDINSSEAEELLQRLGEDPSRDADRNQLAIELPSLEEPMQNEAATEEAQGDPEATDTETED